MNLADVMDAVASQLDTIPGLRAFGYPNVEPRPPTAVVSFPLDYEYDMAYGRGADRMTLPVIVIVGRADERTARDLLSVYLDGSGLLSVKTVLESGIYQAFDTIRVMKVETDVQTFGGADYLTALFHLDIAGSGR